jgi:hypothetical protein
MTTTEYERSIGGRGRELNLEEVGTNVSSREEKCDESFFVLKIHSRQFPDKHCCLLNLTKKILDLRVSHEKRDVRSKMLH